MMKTAAALSCFIVLALTGPCARAARTSANYSIPAETVDTAGAAAQSATYSLKASAVGEFGSAVAIANSSAYIGKAGFVGQLYEIVALSVTAPPSSNLNETASRQLVAAPLADDDTTLAALDPSTVTWSIASGPIASISNSGLATAGTVYQDTTATIEGVAQSLSGQLHLSILNVTNDDFGTYAGDGIDDAWQVQYFGEDNSNAFPNADPDGDGQDNRFEFTAGLVPTDASSRFMLSISAVSGQPTQKSLVFSPLVAGRTYVLEFRTDLAADAWAPLSGTSQSDDGAQRTVIDLNATGAKKFYRVTISKP